MYCGGVVSDWEKGGSVSVHGCAIKFLLYLSYLIKKSSSVEPVEQAVYALSWVHSMAMVQSIHSCSIRLPE